MGHALSQYDQLDQRCEVHLPQPSEPAVAYSPSKNNHLSSDPDQHTQDTPDDSDEESEDNESEYFRRSGYQSAGDQIEHFQLLDEYTLPRERSWMRYFMSALEKGRVAFRSIHMHPTSARRTRRSTPT